MGGGVIDRMANAVKRCDDASCESCCRESTLGWFVVTSTRLDLFFLVRMIGERMSQPVSKGAHGKMLNRHLPRKCIMLSVIRSFSITSIGLYKEETTQRLFYELHIKVCSFQIALPQQ